MRNVLKRVRGKDGIEYRTLKGDTPTVVTCNGPYSMLGVPTPMDINCLYLISKFRQRPGLPARPRPNLK